MCDEKIRFLSNTERLMMGEVGDSEQEEVEVDVRTERHWRDFCGLYTFGENTIITRAQNHHANMTITFLTDRYARE